MWACGAERAATLGAPPVPSGVYADNRLYDAGMLSAPRMHPTDGAQLATATSMPPATTFALATAAAAVGAPAPAPVAAQPAAALGGASAAPGSASQTATAAPVGARSAGRVRVTSIRDVAWAAEQARVRSALAGAVPEETMKQLQSGAGVRDASPSPIFTLQPHPSPAHPAFCQLMLRYCVCCDGTVATARGLGTGSTAVRV